MKEKKQAVKNGFPGTAIVTIMAVIMAAIAALLLYVPQIQVIHICYLICAVVIILGIYLIVHYFMTDSYRNLNEYGFSVGSLLVILGVCGMIRADSLSAVFLTAIGVILVLSCVIKLQYALDLKSIGDKTWVVLVFLTLALTCCGIAVILNPFNDTKLYHLFSFYALLVDNVLSLIVILYLVIRLKLFRKKELKLEQQKQDEKKREEAEQEADEDLHSAQEQTSPDEDAAYASEEDADEEAQESTGIRVEEGAQPDEAGTKTPNA